MSDSPALLALAGLGLSSGISGLAMLRVPRVRPSAALLVFAGLATLSGAVLEATGADAASRLTLVIGGALLAPLALTAYPAITWRHPVDFVSLVVIGASGVLAVVWAGSEATLSAMGLVIACTLIAHTWWKIERATDSDRWALTWMVLAGSLAGMIVFVAAFMELGTVGAVTACLASSTVAPALYIGVRWPEVIDVRGLVVRFVVFVTAAVGYVALFMTLESLIEILDGSVPRAGTLAVIGAVAATTFHPLQVVLRTVVDELLFGARPDPLGAATRVVGHIGDDPVLALRAIREALVLPYAALRLDGKTIAESGAEVTHTRTLPLALGADRTGELAVGVRPGDLTLSAGDDHVLSLVAPLLAQTLRARALAEELRGSRGQAITAIEEERRRLRRDLHDGLGPRLSGIAFTADALRNTLRNDDPSAAEDLLRTLRQETVTAIEDIRELVYAMRPPALDELGLVTALRQQARALRAPDGTPLRVELRAESWPALPAAVEVAAYRIVVEALTNAARHSTSTNATVSLTVSEESFEIEVTDDGSTGKPWRAGVGMTSMGERAAELGGMLTAEGTPQGGRVYAVLPIPP
ncbi:sensor histidine kinase [Nesterenkonia aurantiaca]|uniref:sensor histidine kinase n=1 Tax=Nesterenkonia aurantiaca TaxID=1436010 RepID=UPI003EE43DC4